MKSRVAYASRLSQLLRDFPAVAVVGPRQAGKSTLVRQHAAGLKRGTATYFDLERPADEARLTMAPADDLTLLQRTSGLICIDEIQRQPQLFSIVRPLLDDPRRRARYILLGSASPGVVRGVSESLAGRVGFLDLTPFLACEVEATAGRSRQRLWSRGGFPKSLLARSDRASFEWRDNYFRAFVERDLRQLGLELPAVGLRRLLSLVAHVHGGLLNYSNIAVAMGVSTPTAIRYLEILEGAFLVRRLQPYYANVGKRLVKSPKLYVRDSGLLHAILGLTNANGLRSHPKVGASWEGWVLEQLVGTIALSGQKATPYFWRTHGGAEVDLLVEIAGELIPFETKLADAPRLTRGLVECMKDLGLNRAFVVHGGEATYPMRDGVWALAMTDLADEQRFARLLTAGRAKGVRGSRRDLRGKSG
ncbi:MAG: ATP-binding protein [Polyangiaceae bacterium]